MLKVVKSYYLFKYFGLPKLVNAFGVLVSYYLSILFKKPIHWGRPISISIEPTTSCNLRCPECPSGLRNFTRATGMLNVALFKKVIEEMKSHLAYLTFYFQGEPYLNPHFLEMVALADKARVFTSTSTNAHYLTPEMAKRTVLSGLKRIIISIDGTTQEVYEKYRIGGNLNKVIEGTQNLIAARKEFNCQFPEIIFQFLVVKPNEHQMEEVKKLAMKLGVDKVKFKTAQLNDYQNGNPLLPSNDRFSRYKRLNDNTFVIKSRLGNKCWRLWHSCVITWDGNVLPCCFDKDGKFVMGNLDKTNFSEIWKNEAYFNFRKSLIKSRKEISICKNCTEGLNVWIN